MSAETKSERLFAELCKRHGYRAFKIEPESRAGRRTADFQVSTPHGDIVAEVKELRPNREDRHYIQEMKEKHQATYSSTVGSRAREALRDAAKQLKRHIGRGLPMVAVLYDNVQTADGRVGMPMSFTELHHIDAAMYGNLVVTVPLKGGKVHDPDKAGGGRCLTETRRRYVSAVGVISDWDDQTLYMFHNFFADTPLRVDVFADHKCFHYVKAGHPWTSPWKWQQIGGGQQPPP
jgi:hypothetical protein